MDEEDRNKPHPGSYCQAPGETALCYTFETTAELLAAAVVNCWIEKRVAAMIF